MFVCACASVHVYVCVRMYGSQSGVRAMRLACVYVCACMCLCVCACVCLCAHVRVYGSQRCVRACVYVCVCACVYACVCMAVCASAFCGCVCGCVCYLWLIVCEAMQDRKPPTIPRAPQPARRRQVSRFPYASVQTMRAMPTRISQHTPPHTHARATHAGAAGTHAPTHTGAAQ